MADHPPTGPAAADPNLIPLLRELAAKTVRAAADGRETTTIGPFLAAIHPTNDMIWLNYALPLPTLDVADVTADTVDALRALFRSRGRVLRFEFFQPLWPDLGPAMERHGVKLQDAMPLMVCAPQDLRPVAAPEVTPRPLAADVDDATLRRFITAARTAFGEPAPATDADIAEQRDNLRRGVYRCAHAEIDGQIAGVGSMTVANDELVGIGTLPAYRRRGVAATLSSWLVADHLARGALLAWLSAGDAVAQAVYAKIGFRDAGVQLNYIDGPADGAPG